jgi:hypothetical protein
MRFITINALIFNSERKIGNRSPRWLLVSLKVFFAPSSDMRQESALMLGHLKLNNLTMTGFTVEDVKNTV